MSWHAVERRIAGQSAKPASISIRATIRNGVAVSRPMLLVTLRHILAEQIAWKQREPIGLEIGQGVHDGLIRIIRNHPTPIGRVRVIRKGGMAFNLGHVPALCDEARKKHKVDARKIDDDTIEVVLPKWSDDSDDRTEFAPDADDGPDDTRAVKADEVTINGLTICFGEEQERIVFANREVELTTKQAKFLFALAPEMPRALDLDAIKRKMWGDQVPMRADALIDQMRRDLVSPLQEIGIDLRKTSTGIGLSIIGEAGA